MKNTAVRFMKLNAILFAVGVYSAVNLDAARAQTSSPTPKSRPARVEFHDSEQTQYNLQIKLFVAGKAVSLPNRILIRSGERAKLTYSRGKEKGYLDIAAFEKERQENDKKQAMQFDMEVGSFNSKGEREMHATPSLTAVENETASIESQTPRGQKLKVEVRFRKAILN